MPGFGHDVPMYFVPLFFFRRAYDDLHVFGRSTQGVFTFFAEMNGVDDEIHTITSRSMEDV